MSMDKFTTEQLLAALKNGGDNNIVGQTFEYGIDQLELIQEGE